MIRYIIKIILILNLLIIIKSQNSFALPTNYIPFADSNAVWKTVVFCYPPGFQTFCHYFHDSLGSDTIININTYHKLYRTFYDIYCDTIIINGPYYNGGIRQDTIQKHVNYIDVNAVDTILYRFDLSLGDTLQNTYNTPLQLVVAGIDSFVISGTYRKKFILESINSPGTFFYLFEGIGSNVGLLEPMLPINTILTCYKENNVNLYLDSNLQTCRAPYDSCFFNYLQVISKSSEIIPLYNSSMRIITIDNPNGLKFTFSLYDIYGKEIISEFVSDNYILNLKTPSGLYLYKITFFNNSSNSGKILLN